MSGGNHLSLLCTIAPKSGRSCTLIYLCFILHGVGNFRAPVNVKTSHISPLLPPVFMPSSTGQTGGKATLQDSPSSTLGIYDYERTNIVEPSSYVSLVHGLLVIFQLMHFEVWRVNQMFFENGAELCPSTVPAMTECSTVLIYHRIKRILHRFGRYVQLLRRYINSLCFRSTLWL